MVNIFEEYIPKTITDEYLRRWEQVPKISFEEFYNNAFSEENRRSGASKWYINAEHVLDTYNKYVEGVLDVNYVGISGEHPRAVYFKVIEDAKIFFKDNG